MLAINKNKKDELLTQQHTVVLIHRRREVLMTIILALLLVLLWRVLDVQRFISTNGYNLIGRVDEAVASPDNIVGPLPEVGEVLYQKKFTEVGADQGWIAFSGDWRIEDQSLVQAIPTGFDLGIAYAPEQYQSYVVRSDFRHIQGVGAGLLFNMQQPDSHHNAHMVRYSNEGRGIFWGFFDSAGQFIGQGYATTNPIGREPHILEVYVQDSTYAIRVDGKTMATDIPLTWQSGYVGLSTSQSATAFDSIDVYALPGNQRWESTFAQTFFEDFHVISGDWVNDDGLIRQVLEEPIDYVIGFLGNELPAENYTISVSVNLPVDETLPDVGAGIIFHMTERNNRAGAHMVRFANGGRALIWGTYDQESKFVGDGGVPLALSRYAAHTLTLSVRGEQYDISVNGQIVKTDLQLDRTTGWIGLMSFRGPVTFSDFRFGMASEQVVER